MEKVGREVEEKKKKPKRTTNPGGEPGWGCILITIHGITRCHPTGRQTNQRHLLEVGMNSDYILRQGLKVYNVDRSYSSLNYNV